MPQGMPTGIPNCTGGSVGGGAPCQSLPIATDCMQIGSQPMGGVPCAPPDQGMAVGGCPSIAMPGTPCVIQGTLVEGSPNVTTGPGPQPGVKGTTTAPTPPPGKKI